MCHTPTHSTVQPNFKPMPAHETTPSAESTLRHYPTPPPSREHHRSFSPTLPVTAPPPTADVNPGARARGRTVRWEIEVAPLPHTLLKAAPTGSGALDWLGLATTAALSLSLCACAVGGVRLLVREGSISEGVCPSRVRSLSLFDPPNRVNVCFISS
jgi:hypothetical protein